MKWFNEVAFVLVVLGALNWGLEALAGFNLVTAVLGGFVGADKVLYILMGASAIYVAATHKWKW